MTVDPFGRFVRNPAVRRRYEQTIDGLVQLLADSEAVTVLSGAGISTASGLQDFRSKGGLWENTDPMQECSLSAFRRDPARFWAFYIARLTVHEDIKPNAAHEAIVELERMGKVKWVLTQNIDGLHQAAGSTRVVELHGSPATVSCPSCGQKVTWEEAMSMRDDAGVVPCEHGHPMKPDIVLFEERLPDQPFQRAHLALASSDLLLCVGSSLVVHPVAGLPALLVAGGGDVAILTGSSTPQDALAQVKLTDPPLQELLPEAVRRLKLL